MLHCHKDHDVSELYTKVDFRCDCGNGRMPDACMLNNDKDYENDKNRYDKTFFDCYCYCNSPNFLEEMDKFMIQCYNCEDWFHNHHTKPALEENIDENFIMICSTCIEK
jgi:E3 ubiquitin-protein ligase UBR7